LNVKTNDNYDYHTVKPNIPFKGVSLGCDARKYSPEFSGVHMMQEDRMDHRDYSLEQACSFPTEESEERGVFPALDQSAVGFKFGRVLEIGKNTLGSDSKHFRGQFDSDMQCNVSVKCRIRSFVRPFPEIMVKTTDSTVSECPPRSVYTDHCEEDMVSVNSPFAILM
jgi:hypothetical protein